MLGSSVSQIRAVLSAEDRNYTSTMMRAAGMTDRLSKGMKKYIGIGAAVAVGQKAIGTAMSAVSSNIGSAISRYDQLNRFPQTLNNLGISTKAAKKATDELSKGIDGLPTTLDSATQGVSRLVSTNGNIKKSTKYFLAMNNAVIAGGASTELQASAVEQLSQAYSKGRMDMMEWRSIQTAMPGQLKQIGKAMGMSTAELGEGLRSGTVSMDEFMDTMVKLNNEGVDGFSSFADQAQSSVGGIQTAMSLIQSAITRGLANCIESIDKMLEKNGMPKIADMAIIVRDKVNEAFSGVQKAIEKVDLKGIAASAAPYWNILKKSIEALAGVAKSVGGFFLEHSATLSKLIPVLLIATTAFRGFVGAVGAINSFEQFMGKVNSARAAIRNFANDERVVATTTAISNKVIATSQAVFGKVSKGIRVATSAVLKFAAANRVAMIAALGIAGPIIAMVAYMAKFGSSVDKMAKKINDFADKAAAGITAFAKQLPALLPTVIQAGIKLFMGLIESLSQVIDPLVAAIPGIVNTVANSLKTMAPTLAKAGVTLFLAIVKAIPKIIPPLIKAIPTIIKGIVKTLWNSRGQIKSAGAQIMRSLLGGITSLFGNILSSVKNFAKKIPQRIKSGLGSLASVGRNLVQGLWNGIKGKFSSVTAYVQSLASRLPKAVKKVLGIKSPSRVMFSVGEYFSEGLANGITSMGRTVAKAAEDVVHIPEISNPKPLAFSIAGYDGSLNVDKYSYADMNYTFVVESYIDGKKAAEGIVPHAEPIMEKRQQRISRNRGIR